MQKKTKMASRTPIERPAEQPPRAIQIDGYRDLLETLRALHADPQIIATAERVVREREDE
jgi:hypothetical protein